MEDRMTNKQQFLQRPQFIEDITHQQTPGAAHTDMRCLLNDSYSEPPYTSDTEITSATWESSFFESSPETTESPFTSSSEALEATPKRRHPGPSANIPLSPQIIHQQKKRTRGEQEFIIDNSTNMSTPISTGSRSWSFSGISGMPNHMKDSLQSVVYPANGSFQQNWSVDEDSTSPREWTANYNEEGFNQNNQSTMAGILTSSAPYIRTSFSGEEYIDSKNSPQYQAIAQELEGILDMHDEKSTSASSQPIRRRWRGLAPIPHPQTSPSEVLLQQQQQLNYRATSPVNSVSLHSSLDGFTSNVGPRGKILESLSVDSGRRNYTQLPPPASYDYDSNVSGNFYGENGRNVNMGMNMIPAGNCNSNNAQSSGQNPNAKEIRWKHQTDMLRTKFSNKNQKNGSARGNDGPPPLSAKSFITKWKLNV